MDASTLDRAREYLQDRRLPELQALAAELHPADLAEILTEVGDADRLTLLLLLDPQRAADVLEELPAELSVPIVARLSDEQATGLILEMEADEAADLLGELPLDRARRVLQRMRREDADEMRHLLRYAETSAGGLMTTEFVAVSDHLRASDAIDELRRIGQETEIPYYVYVVDGYGALRGVFSLRDVLASEPEVPVREMMRTDVVSVPPETDQDAASRIIEKYDLLALPVTGAGGRLLGIITADDLVRVAEQEATADVVAAAGGIPEPYVIGAFPWGVARRRTAWMLVNLFTALVHPLLLRQFHFVLERHLAVVFFLPLVLATAGNIGTQSMSSAIRALSAGAPRGRALFHAAAAEAFAGAWTGLAAGALVSAAVWVWFGDPRLAGLLMATMVVALGVTAASGVILPSLLDRAGVDPAVSSGPFVTTVSDVIGQLSYIGLAALVLVGSGGAR
jgi:magnesium transporter